MSTFAIRALSTTEVQRTLTLTRLSTGQQLNQAADGAAELAVGTEFSSQNRSLVQAMRNINDGIALTSTADRAAGQVGDILGRMRELAVRSSTGTLSSSERTYLQDEFSALSEELQRVSDTTAFNGINLTDGSVTSVSVQAGVDGSSASQINTGLSDLSVGTLGMGGADLSTEAGAQAAITSIDSAIDSVNGFRSQLGASMNALESAFRSADSRLQAQTAAESAILDADFAQEAANDALFEVQQEAGVAALVQANGINASTVALL